MPTVYIYRIHNRCDACDATIDEARVVVGRPLANVERRDICQHVTFVLVFYVYNKRVLDQRFVVVPLVLNLDREI